VLRAEDKALWHSLLRLNGLGCDALMYVARTQEDNLIYINAVLDRLEPSYYKVVSFDELLASPEQALTPLASFLNVNATELLETFRAKVVTRKTPLLDSKHADFLRANVFTDEKFHLWRHLYRSTSTPLRKTTIGKQSQHQQQLLAGQLRHPPPKGANAARAAPLAAPPAAPLAAAAPAAPPAAPAVD
jgi:hypothetical protein